jgi:thiamine phosphate synthase YjbQ (UPF0047 family)
MQILNVKTDRRTQLLDVTAQVQKAVAAAGVARGVCYLYVPHTGKEIKNGPPWPPSISCKC